MVAPWVARVETVAEVVGTVGKEDWVAWAERVEVESAHVACEDDADDAGDVHAGGGHAENVRAESVRDRRQHLADACDLLAHVRADDNQT